MKIFCILLFATAGAMFISCKGSSTDSSGDSTAPGSKFDFRGMWVEQSNDQLQKVFTPPLATLTITTNTPGVIGKATYPSVNAEYPVTLSGHDSAWAMTWGPPFFFGSPIKMCVMNFYNLAIVSSGDSTILKGPFNYRESFPQYTGSDATLGIAFVKK